MGAILNASINDDTRYGNNCWITDSQSKEEREAKIPRLSLGNAKVAWILDAVNGEGKIKLAEKEEVAESSPSTFTDESKDLPF